MNEDIQDLQYYGHMEKSLPVRICTRLYVISVSQKMTRDDNHAKSPLTTTDRLDILLVEEELHDQLVDMDTLLKRT